MNYTSGVVLERNSLLNLAIIAERVKISRWLIEEKGADLESSDRGGFSPLINAAWNGDKKMVRYLLARGCDRNKVGLFHSSKGLCPPSFKGHTAEGECSFQYRFSVVISNTRELLVKGWAKKRGHEDVADLIRIGL